MASREYQPSQEILAKYADVLTRFALNSGKGIRPGEVVYVLVPDVAKPLGHALQRSILQAGGQPMIQLTPTGWDKDYFSLANDAQLTFFPRAYLQERVKLINHSIHILAEPDPFELADVDPEKLLKSRDAKKDYRDWLIEKETKGNFTWTLALWGVPAKAKIAKLSLEKYWEQIIAACFLDDADPVAKWQQLHQQQLTLKSKLNELKMAKAHFVGPDMDIHFTVGADRTWEGGSGRNIPSFEFFTSPDWRGTTGWVKFNQPVFRYGQVMEGISLEFANGVLTRAHARKGNAFLQQMIKSENANKVGEISLTDKRMSRITHFMADTLFDENIGGPFGNTHLALGMAYHDCYRGSDAAKLTKEDWDKKGYNDSPEHTDIISTEDRTVTATLTDGSEVVIYRDGMFTML